MNMNWFERRAELRAIARDESASGAERARAIKSLGAEDPAVMMLRYSANNEVNAAIAFAIAAGAQADTHYPLGGGAT